MTTPGRQEYLYDLQDVSQVSHTAEYPLKVLEQVSRDLHYVQHGHMWLNIPYSLSCELAPQTSLG